MTFSGGFGRAFRPVFDPGMAAAIPYTQKVLGLFGATLVGYYPLSENSGTTVYDASGNGRNGTLSGSYTLGAQGIGDGGTAINFNAGTASIFDGLRVGSPWDIFAEGSLFGWMQITDGAVWSDGQARFIAHQTTDWSGQGNRVGKSNESDEIRYQLGSSNEIRFSVGHPTAWQHIGATWSQTSNSVVLYWNGASVNSATWVNFAGTYTQVSISQLFKGALAHVAFLSRAATSGEMLGAATL